MLDEAALRLRSRSVSASQCLNQPIPETVKPYAISAMSGAYTEQWLHIGAQPGNCRSSLGGICGVVLSQEIRDCLPRLALVGVTRRALLHEVRI